MATVNLNNLFKKPVNPNSSIKYVYQDFNTMSMETLYSNNIAAQKVKTDLNVSYDINAVKNSVANILSTKKSEKILSPEFGLRLEDYLFEPVTDTTASAIAADITNTLTTFEPRVQLVNLQVIPYPDQYLYQINMGLRVPNLKQSLSLQGLLQGDQFTIL